METRSLPLIFAAIKDPETEFAPQMLTGGVSQAAYF
jgi:hypothetical protein